MSQKSITICYVPGRESSYVRNRVLIKGFKEIGVNIIDCSHPKKTALRYLHTFFNYLKNKSKADVILIGFLGQPLVPFVRLTTRKPIIFDTFVSMYQTLAFDRQSIKPKGASAWLVRFLEKLSCQWADICFLDTEQHIQYFLKEYGLDKNKFFRSFLGADNTRQPITTELNNKKPIIHFHGEFQALHGTKYIIDAARLLPDVHFRLIGGGMELAERRRQAEQLNLKNITFIPTVQFDEIPDYIAQATICLGLLGETEKVRLVIPFKIFETLCMAKPIITADTSSIRELLTHRHDVYLCEAANSQSLAEAITTLLNDASLRENIARNGYRTFNNRCSPPKIASDILRITQQYLESRENVR